MTELDIRNQGHSVHGDHARHIAALTKKANRRASWNVKIMEVQWPSFVLPLARAIKAMGIEDSDALDRHQDDLVCVLENALNEYRKKSEEIMDKSGLMPFQIPDATRYAIYLGRLMDEILDKYVPTASLELKRMEPGSESVKCDRQYRERVYEIICSKRLMEYLKETGNDKAIVMDAADHCA